MKFGSAPGVNWYRTHFTVGRDELFAAVLLEAGTPPRDKDPAKEAHPMSRIIYHLRASNAMKRFIRKFSDDKEAEVLGEALADFFDYLAERIAIARQ